MSIQHISHNISKSNAPNDPHPKNKHDSQMMQIYNNSDINNDK